jgi:5-methylcytosine-specific restriction endonuclease McrA
MNQRVLVLNQDYSPLTVCSVQRAFLLIFLDKAELISGFDGQFLRTVTNQYPKPAVVRIMNYISIPYKEVELSRQNVFKRDSYRCQYCGTTKDLTLDHVLPRSRKGRSSWTNRVTACKSCNTR